MAMAKQINNHADKEPLAELVPQDCVAIQEIMQYAHDLAEREKKEGYEQFGDAAKGRTHLSRMLSSIITGHLEKGCSWFDFSEDSAWRTEGRFDELTLRVFKAAELYSKHKYPGKAIAFHDSFASMVVAATLGDTDSARKAQLVRRAELDRGLLNPDMQERFDLSITALDFAQQRIEGEK